ncbi:telomere-associated protein RIF1 [Orussus abietinus]|uniref:telomere-associated protein RIF1 n=1 Tax=Orussus abietinus TaxID=222816 RepID=UPI0006265BB3|nr:telomere-associated protein RIF1 [Orussus abietinus]
MACDSQRSLGMLKALREAKGSVEKCEALAYFSSNAFKLESTTGFTKEQYKELLTLVLDAFMHGDLDVHSEASLVLKAILSGLKSPKLFALLHSIDNKQRLKFCQFLENVEDKVLLAVTEDEFIVKFFTLCLPVDPSKEWIVITGCEDNLQQFLKTEDMALSSDQEIESQIINSAIELLRRLYERAPVTSDSRIRQFDRLIMDPIIKLAYMGHKRHRSSALKLLQQTMNSGIGTYARENHGDLWLQYKNLLQSTYYKRMALLVSACNLDWATQWTLSLLLLGTDLHRGAGLINNLLSVEEKAFKSTDTTVRRQAFLCWKLLIDNFALDPRELATSRRIKLLCIPLNAKNSKTELIALTKLEVWWHLIVKLYPDISKFVTVLTQFLNFSFGPLGDTPLMSAKCDVVASPGKRFYKTKVVAVDMLFQLLVVNEEDRKAIRPVAEERLPHAVTDVVFRESYKSFVHSIGEVTLILDNLNDKDFMNREQLGRILWTNLLARTGNISDDLKTQAYRDSVLVATELTQHLADKPMILEIFLRDVLQGLANVYDRIPVRDDATFTLVLKFMTPAVLKNLNKNHCEALKQLLWPKDTISYPPNMLSFVRKVLEKLISISKEHSINFATEELWCILAKLMTKYMSDGQEINEGNAAEHNFQTILSLISFPFTNIHWQNILQTKSFSGTWRNLYKQFDAQADLVATVRPNEILITVTELIQKCLEDDNKCYSFAINCLDALLSSINYDCLLAMEEVPNIVQLIADLTIRAFQKKHNIEVEIALKSLSALLITIYGLNPNKVTSYLMVVRPVIDLMLVSRPTEKLNKEVPNVWETVVSIFRGLNKQLSYDLLSAYRETITRAVSHSHPEIQEQAFLIFDIQENLEEKAKGLLAELSESLKLHPGKVDRVAKKETEKAAPKQVKIVGSFLNRRPSTPRPYLGKGKEKEERKPVQQIDPDSQEYVLIESDVRFEVNRLTEHQKEILKRRREDIPALYNDLSQSTSQDSDNLQQWFDNKIKQTAELEREKGLSGSNKEIKPNVDFDANKENKRETDPPKTLVDERVSSPKIDLKLINNVELIKSNSPVEVNGAKSTENSAKGSFKLDESELAKNDDTSSATSLAASEKIPEAPRENETLDASGESVAKKLNFESRDEFPEEKDQVEGSRKKSRNSLGKSEVGSSKNEGRLLRGKGKPGSAKMANEDATDASKKGVKRKAASDSESEAGQGQRRRRKTTEEISDTDSVVSSESDHVDCNGMLMDRENVSQRTRKEMSRLQINMNFDSPLPNRRRSKANDEESGKKGSRRKSQGAADGKVKLGEGQMKTHRASVGRPKKNLDAQSSQDNGLQRRRKSSKQDERPEETNENEAAGEVNIPQKRTSPVEAKLGSKVFPKEDLEEPKPKSGRKTTPDRSLPGQSEQDEEPEEELQAEDKDVKISKPAVVIPETIIENPEEHDIGTQDIVESSQESSLEAQLEKKCTERKCFIKINKIEAPAGDKMEEDKVNESAEVLPRGNLEGGEIINDSEEVEKSVHQSQVIEDVEDESLKQPAVEPRPLPIGDPPQTSKPSHSGFHFSPKSGKRFAKLKMLSSQGRAAQMLGLIAKQTGVENEGQILARVEEELKKPRSRDFENEGFFARKEKILPKEPEKFGNPSGSRQEKIFNNMKITEFCASSLPKPFVNLKNDGEKVSPKMEKASSGLESMDVDSEIKIDQEETSIRDDDDDLPMLEWSSTNPPSLTASPSTSILKRGRQAAQDQQDNEITPGKKKRVSFADPPVSKEMGYEISSTGSPHRISKLSIARVSSRIKEGSIKPKSPRFRMIQLDSDDEDKIKEAIVTEDIIDLDSRTEEENELLRNVSFSSQWEATEKEKIFDVDLEEEKRPDLTSDSVAEMVDLSRIDSVAEEVEIISDSGLKEDENQKTDPQEPAEDATMKEPSEDASSVVPGTVEDVEVMETQEDIFCVEKQKYLAELASEHVEDTVEVTKEGSEDPIHSSTPESSSTSAVSNNNDSLVDVADSAMDRTRSEDLEDTVDVQNVTGLNTSESSVEMASNGPIRSSTRANLEPEADQSTVTVTDSVFGSLAFSQDSQPCSMQLGVEPIPPESLDSTRPICPSLCSSEEALDSLAGKLTNPLWKESLLSEFSDRGLRTVGDLARLSEREVNRLPVKGHPKVEFVRNVLRRVSSSPTLQGATVVGRSFEETPSAVLDSVPTSASPSASSSALNFTPPPASTPNQAPLSPDIVSSTRSSPPMTTPKSSINESTVPLAVSQSSTQRSLSEPTKKPTLSATRPESPEIFMVQRVPRVATVTSGNDAASSSRTKSKTPTTQTDTPSIRRYLIVKPDIEMDGESVRRIEPSTSQDASTSEASKREVARLEAPPTSKVSVGTLTDVALTKKATKSVEAQMALEDLLDEIDVTLVLQSAVRRCSPETILTHYKAKMKHMPDSELHKETMRILGLDDKLKSNELNLRTACRACGINKVLLRLPDIFCTDKEFFTKVLIAYKKKLKVADCLEALDFAEVKDAMCHKCNASELAEMLSKKLQEEEQQGIEQPITEPSSLDAILKRMPMDVIISHTVANEEVVPARLVLDIAVQNNSHEAVASALKSQGPARTSALFEALWSSRDVAARIREGAVPREDLLEMFGAVSESLTAKDLLEAFGQAMRLKLIKDEPRDALQ